MSGEVAVFAKKLEDFSLEFDSLLVELVEIRKESPQVKAETAKLLEKYMINVSKQLKQMGKENNDDLTEGISFLKIKLLG